MSRPIVGCVFVVNADDFPTDVREWCGENDISIHCSSELYQMDLDGNPLHQFFVKHGAVFPDTDHTLIGVIGS